jgi:hypothetical protein
MSVEHPVAKLETRATGSSVCMLATRDESRLGVPCTGQLTNAGPGYLWTLRLAPDS